MHMHKLMNMHLCDIYIVNIHWRIEEKKNKIVKEKKKYENVTEGIVVFSLCVKKNGIYL